MDSLAPFIPLVVVLIFWLGLALYWGKRVEKHKRSAVADPSRPAGHLTLTRKVDGTNYLRKLKIFVDDEIVCLISVGETVHLKLPEGPHQISVKIDWCKTEPITIEIDNARNTQLICGSTFNDWKCIFTWAVDPKNYLYVRAAS